MATVTSLYICISSIYIDFYNFNYLSITYTLPIACQSLSVHILCLWHIFYLYFYCIHVSMLYISYTYHVHFLSCSYSVHVSYTFISHIFSHNLSYTVMYLLSTFCTLLVHILFVFYTLYFLYEIHMLSYVSI